MELKKVNKFSESEKKNVYIMEKEIKSLRDDENKKTMNENKPRLKKRERKQNWWKEEEAKEDRISRRQ